MLRKNKGKWITHKKTFIYISTYIYIETWRRVEAELGDGKYGALQHVTTWLANLLWEICTKQWHMSVL